MLIEFVNKNLDVGFKWPLFMMVDGFLECLFLILFMMIGLVEVLNIMEDGISGLIIRFKVEPDFGFILDLVVLQKVIVGINLNLIKYSNLIFSSQKNF